MKERVFVLIHGAGMDGSAWAALAPHLPGRSVMPVLPGHGGDKEPGLVTIEAMAENLTPAISGLPPFVLCGHSMGALVAMAMAASMPPGRLEALVLLGANALMPVNAQLLQAASADSEGAFAMILKWGVFKGADPSVRERLAATRKAPAPGVLAQDLAACDAWRDTASCAAGISVPVLVVAGLEDKMTPSAGAEELAGLFAHADMASMPGAGHMMMAEKPAETARIILDFLEERAC